MMEFDGAELPKGPIPLTITHQHRIDPVQIKYALPGIIDYKLIKDLSFSIMIWTTSHYHADPKSYVEDLQDLDGFEDYIVPEAIKMLGDTKKNNDHHHCSQQPSMIEVPEKSSWFGGLFSKIKNLI
ncbi:hypothetical protein DFA_04597 [Cavenderia fasciculata]|uniref:Uncharacterized protein n=1 Tax=Cavenderia fasciculata TaxID=261658 RepID=F4PQ06_CACFS|nr:uncharacterized protein DFA_04597 [Cavenderia fasciculata]EGG22469.1 hypothetical protein DFA_04597 [Cavenderia fasciculata]|eukprot:XP_004360320.1 hypothetical protein DFA_04597 [Cavenderia fasciculata]